MKLIKNILLLSMLMLSFKSLSLMAQEQEEYILSADDEISITVFNEPELSVQKIKINTSGNISMPLIGQVAAKGLTINQLEQQVIAKLLEGYLKKPNVSIVITEYRPFYITGEVKKPGSYPYRKDLTVQKAVSIAGGFTERASKSKIVLKNEQNEVSDVSLTDAVKPGDVITISESFF